MADFFIKEGDTSPAIQRQLTDTSGVPIDISGVNEIRFLMVKKPGDTPKVDSTWTNGNVTMPNGGSDGVVKYEWQPGDTDTPGRYKVEFELEYGDGTTETFPGDHHLIVSVRKDSN